MQYKWTPLTRVKALLPKVLLALILPRLCGAQNDQSDLSKLSLEQLSKVEITSLSKKEQKLSDAAAAVFVITEQDIRNSTATSVPELLHLVPGLDVAQLNGNRWAISSRGFAEQYADKMLVMIDGRTVFDPLFTGVLWAEHDLMLEDIERIEVIRGPGTTIWGTNAVNGVVNIITKSASATQGMLVTAEAGNNAHALTSARYGGTLGKSVSYRVFAKYYNDGPAGEVGGLPSHDSIRSMSGGFRLDGRYNENHTFMVEARGYGLKAGQDATQFNYTPPFITPLIDDQAFSGENMTGRWIYQSSSGSLTTLQASFSHVVHDQSVVNVNGNVATASLQHERRLGERQNLIFGTDYYLTEANTASLGSTIWWSPSNPYNRVAGAFAQDEVLFAGGRVRITGGLRVEHLTNAVALQPEIRALWKLNDRNSWWAAYGRSVQSGLQDDLAMNVNVAAFPGRSGLQVLRIVGNPKIKPEKADAFEAGYRWQATKTVFIDVATFYGGYFDLINSELGQPFLESGPPPRLVLPLVNQNDLSGGTFGGELMARWVPSENLRFVAAYSLMESDFDGPNPTAEAAGKVLEGQTPRHQLDIASTYNLVRALSLNTSVSFVDRRPSMAVPGFTQVDTRLVWRPKEPVELSLGAKNLFNKEHVEFISSQGGVSTVLGRSVFGKVAWHY